MEPEAEADQAMGSYLSHRTCRQSWCYEVVDEAVHAPCSCLQRHICRQLLSCAAVVEADHASDLYS